jgi:hypothetical protein
MSVVNPDRNKTQGGKEHKGRTLAFRKEIHHADHEEKADLFRRSSGLFSVFLVAFLVFS